MSLQDPISDMLTRIRNGQMAEKRDVVVSFSNINVAIANVLKTEGYIDEFELTELANNKRQILIFLKYYEENPVIRFIRRISRPSARVYRAKNALPVVKQGLGVAIISTPKGVMTNKQAERCGVGGEVLCEVM